MSIVVSDYDRNENEAYYTPEWATEALLSRWSFDLYTPVWEPACGEGHIVRVLQKRWHSQVFATGINTGKDFFKTPLDHAGDATTIITNPPYGHDCITGENFALHAIEMLRETEGIVAMLFRTTFKCAERRQKLMEHPTYAGEIVITKRIRWANLPVKLDKKGIPIGPGPNNQMSWFIWDHKKPFYDPPITKFFYGGPSEEEGDLLTNLPKPKKKGK